MFEWAIEILLNIFVTTKNPQSKMLRWNHEGQNKNFNLYRFSPLGVAFSTFVHTKT